jgi:DNA-binding NarL/FixJ family response regulator
MARVPTLIGNRTREPGQADEPNRTLSFDIRDKELELVRLVAEGLNNKEIAARVFLSEGTVRNQLSVILEKLGLRDRTQLAIFYYKNWQP